MEDVKKFKNFTEQLNEGKFEDVKQVGNGIKYKNEIFPGINVPKKNSVNEKYKWRVLAREGDKVKVINFCKVGKDKKPVNKLSKKYWESQSTWQ
jgi:hypothetical protein